MHKLLTLLLAVGLLALTDRAAAQCAPMPGTGCPGQTAPICATPPVIGTAFIFRCPPTCFPGPTQFVIIGTPLGTPLPLPSPPLCVPGCLLGCQPLVVLNAPGATLNIPNNPSLIGLILCVQCLCQTASGCFNLSQAMTVTIQ